MEEPKYIENFSTRELEQELEHRKNKKPERLLYPNWTATVELVRSVIEQERLPKDFEHFLMESVLEAIYGQDIWKWWNSKLGDR